MHAKSATARELLARLVAFDTTSAKTNVPLIDFVRATLDRHGVAYELVPTADGEKVSLYASIGPPGIPGVCLSGHTDVVPVTGQVWSSDPFTLVERDGRLHGRGACDMKGFLACMLAMAPSYQARALRTPIHLAFSYDEEVGCTGVRPMITELGHRLTRPRLVIVGEPTNLTVVDAHKGATRYRTTVTGREAHSSMAHLGVNAIHIAGILVAELAGIADELQTIATDERFTPNHATLQVGLIEGGRAQNIVPRHAAFSWEIRDIPGFDQASVLERFEAACARRLPAMRRVAVDATITTELMNGVPAFHSGAGSEAVALAATLTGQNATYAVSYGTEAGLFQEAGSPSVICGPGDIAQAHTPDEWIFATEIDRCLAFLDRLGDWAERN